jgi:hypothetical protein
MLIPSYRLTNYLVLVLIPFDPMQQYVPYNEGAVLLACGAVVYLFIWKRLLGQWRANRVIRLFGVSTVDSTRRVVHKDHGRAPFCKDVAGTTMPVIEIRAAFSPLLLPAATSNKKWFAESGEIPTTRQENPKRSRGPRITCARRD